MEAYTQGIFNRPVFMGGCGCLLFFCILKRHTDTKKSFIHCRPSCKL